MCCPLVCRPPDVAAADRRLVRHATRVDAGIVTKLGQRIADHLNPDGSFTDEDRARRRGLRLGPQGPDGMSRLQGLLDPEARAYLEAVEAAVRRAAINPAATTPRRPTSGHRPSAATTRSSWVVRPPSRPAGSACTAAIP